MKLENDSTNHQLNFSPGETFLIHPTVKGIKSFRYRAVKEHLCCNLNGTSVILSLASGKYYGVNSVGSFIWSVIQKAKTFDEIQESVLEEFEVEEEICKREVLSFLEKMAEQSLIEVLNEKAD